MVFGEVSTELFHPCQDGGESWLGRDGIIVELCDDHDDKVGIGKEVHFVEGMLRLIDFVQNFKQSINLV